MFSNVGTFAVPLLAYIHMENHIKWVACTRSDKDAVIRIVYIKIYYSSIIIGAAKCIKIGFFVKQFPKGFISLKAGIFMRF